MRPSVVPPALRSYVEVPTEPKMAGPRRLSQASVDQLEYGVAELDRRCGGGEGVAGRAAVISVQCRHEHMRREREHVPQRALPSASGALSYSRWQPSEARSPAVFTRTWHSASRPPGPRGRAGV
jgi:hypothetical protein